MNQVLVYVEMLFILLISIGLTLSMFMLEDFDKCNKSMSVLVAGLFIVVYLASASFTVPILKRDSSFFYLGPQTIEYNLIFENRRKNTTSVAIKEISHIDETDSSFVLHLDTGKTLYIKKKLLALLEGYEVLFDQFRELRNKIDSSSQK
jgi:hypothetical protein